MKTTKILSVAFFMLAINPLVAQDYTFKVLINKGQNAIRTGNDWTPVKVGASLRSADELKVSQNGYLGLVHHSGKPLEVKDAGQHKVVDLAAKIKGGSGVLNKYTDFILSYRDEKRTNLTATGAVHRGTGEIKMYLPKPQQAIVFNDNVAIAWSKEQRTKVYVIQFNSMFGDELERLEVQDTAVTVDLNSDKFAHEDNIVVKVYSKEDAGVDSEDFVLKKLSAADKARITASLRDLGTSREASSALDQLYLASFYEENGLLIDASPALQTAVKLAPGVPDFREAYQLFVARNSLKN